MLAVMALLWVFALTMFVGVTVIVGAVSIDPRSAALMMVAPALVLAIAAAAYTPTRRLFGRIFYLS